MANGVAFGIHHHDADKEWTVIIARDVEEVVVRQKQPVLATRISGKPNILTVKGQDRFKGEQHHSSRHPGPDGYKGKKVVVLGSNNSAHDICTALYEAGVDVTIVQRSSRHIVRSEPLMEHGLGALYSEQALQKGVTTAKADLIFASLPYRIMKEFQKPIYGKIREIDADFYAALKKAGFRLDFGADGSGLFLKYLRRGPGYYIDIGASQLIIDITHGRHTDARLRRSGSASHEVMSLAGAFPIRADAENGPQAVLACGPFRYLPKGFYAQWRRSGAACGSSRGRSSAATTSASSSRAKRWPQ